MKRSRTALLPLTALVLGFMLVGQDLQRASAVSLTGAIWTSFAHGTETDGNVYPGPGPGADFTACNTQLTAVGLPNTSNAKDCVFMNGGANAPGAAVLPPSSGVGNYVFQVTDPSGATLLSNDKAGCRQFTVGANGRIDGVVSYDDSPAPGVQECKHKIGHDHEQTPHGDIKTIQLNRSEAGGGDKFGNTPNKGGEYKVWITTVTDFQAAGGSLGAVDSGSPFHGFVGGTIKTDNFKVRQGQLVTLGSIAGVKYYDCNSYTGTPPTTCNNGDLNPSVESGIPNWPIKICRLSSTGGAPGTIAVGDCVVTLTSVIGAYSALGLGDGSYCIREARSRDVDTDPANANFNTFDWKQTEPTSPASSVTFGSTTNGTAAAGCNGSGAFNADLMNGDYTPVTISGGNSVTGRDFGNVARQLVARTDGLTWGYWKTHTGTAATASEAPKDAVYSSTLGIDIGTTSGTHLDVDTPENADVVFAADGDGSLLGEGSIGGLCSVADCRPSEFVPPADCSGDCHEQLAAQLLALELNCIKFSSFCSALYLNVGDPLSGLTVGAIVSLGDAALTAWFNGGACASGGFSCNQIHSAVDAINNNASSGVLFNLVLLGAPPSPLCFVGFSGVPDALGTVFTCP